MTSNGSRERSRNTGTRKLLALTAGSAALATGLLAQTAGASGTASVVALTGAGGASQWPSSEFAHSLSSRPLASSSASETYRNDLIADYKQDYGSVGINELPVWTVGPSQAPVTVSVRSGCNNFTVETGTRIPIPSAASTSSSDGPLVIYQPSTHSDWELWQASRAGNGTWSACWGGKLSTASSAGVFPSPFGLSASGISYLATTITEADVQTGAIHHSLAVDLPRCNAPQAPPADRSDCGNDSGQPREGTWYRLPSTVPMPTGLTKFAQMVFRSLQNYGMVVTDQAGAVMVGSESTSDWQAAGHSGTDPITASWQGKPEYEVLAGIPWNDLEVLQP